MPPKPITKTELTIRFANGGVLTPDDIALIEVIRAQRSIIGAGRKTGVSYRKCWLSVDALNHMFETPVIATFPGRREGGAELTPFGERLVAVYKSMERRTRAGSAPAIKELMASLDFSYRPRASGGVLEEPLAERNPLRSRRS